MIPPSLPLSVKTTLVNDDTFNQVLDSLGNVLGAFKDPQHADYVVEMVNTMHNNGFDYPEDIADRLNELSDLEDEIQKLQDNIAKAEAALACK